MSFSSQNPFSDRTILLKDGGTISLGDGDFLLSLPDNSNAYLRLRSGLPLFPITSPQGEAPAEYLIRQLETTSTKHAQNSYNQFRLLCGYLSEQEAYKVFSWTEVDEALLLRYLAFLRSVGREYEFARLRHFYRWASDAGYEGFSREIAGKLDALRIRGNEKGEAVRTGDRERGPLSEAQFRLVLRELSLDTGSLLPRVCTWLCVELGANPAQFCQLRTRDYRTYETSGETLYHIHMPRSKKGDGYRERRQRPLSPRLGRLLGQYIAATARIRERLDMDDPFMLLTESGKPMTDAHFSLMLQRFADESGLSEIIDGPLNARRFRRTFATRLVGEGASEEYLMDLLDHSDAQNVSVYFEMRGDSFSRINDAVNPELEPLAGRFMGRIADTEADAKLGDRKEQRVKAPFEIGDIGIGTCGYDIRVNGLCQLHPPYACYTCPLFQPWRDADHRGLAVSIREQRDALAALEGGDEGGRVVGQLDELMASVTEVAEACEDPPPQVPRRKRKPKNSENP